MHSCITRLVAGAAISLLASFAPARQSWAVPTLELFESATDETLVRGFFERTEIKVTSHGTEPLPGFKMSVDFLPEEDTESEVSFINGEFVAGPCVPVEDSDCISFKNAGRDKNFHSFVSNFTSDKFDPPEKEDPEKFVISDKSGNPILNITVFSADEAVPEPAAWALMIVGFGMAGYALRRRRCIRIA